MKIIIYLYILTLCFVSCNKEKHTYYFYDEEGKDTMMSVNFLDKKTFDVCPKVKIVLRDSIYDKKSIENLLVKTDFQYLLKSEKSVNVCDFFLYKKLESLSEFKLYNDSNYYLTGNVIFLNDGRPHISLLFENFYLRDKALLKKQREREVEDSIKRDSVMTEFAKQNVQLSFMGYKLGGPFHIQNRLSLYSIIKTGETIQGEEIDDVDISHYDNTIYEIKVYIKDYTDGLYDYQLNKILDLYREKYGNNYGGKEWTFSNSSVIIETKSQEFTIGKNGALLKGKHRGMPQRDVITEIIITYHDYEVDSILRVKRQKDEVVKKKEGEEKVRHQQLLDNI